MAAWCSQPASRVAPIPGPARRLVALCAKQHTGLPHSPPPLQQQQQQQLSRRSLFVALPAAAALPLLPPAPAGARVAAGDWSSPGLAAPEDDAAPRFFKAEGGVKVQVLSEGSGPEAQRGDRVLIDYVLRRSNGYFIYGTVEGVSFQPRDVPVGPVALQLGDGSVLPGLEAALVGMRPGGKRRMLVPPESGYLAGPGLRPTMPTFATQRQLENHKNEPLLFEVQMLRVGDRRQ